MPGRLQDQRGLVTYADRYTGPPVVELFAAEGAQVAEHRLQVNGFGPAHIESNTYDDTDEVLATGAGDSPAGQVVPISGGWTTRRRLSPPRARCARRRRRPERRGRARRRVLV